MTSRLRIIKAKVLIMTYKITLMALHFHPQSLLLLPYFLHTVSLGLSDSGLPLWLSWERICPQCGRPGFNTWVGKIPWRRERLPTPVFWPGEFHGLYSPWGCKELDTTDWLSLSLYLTQLLTSWLQLLTPALAGTHTYLCLKSLDLQFPSSRTFPPWPPRPR